MSNIRTLVFIAPLLFIVLIGRLRSYIRTGLKGDLLITIGGIVFFIAFLLDNDFVGIAGFIVINIGLIILATIESGKRKEIFYQTSFFDRLIGNVPLIENRKDFPRAYRKQVGILTGIICIFIAVVFYKRLTTFEIIEVVYIGILALAGVSFIGFSLVQRNKKQN